jgi:hypothetical protein
VVVSPDDKHSLKSFRSQCMDRSAKGGAYDVVLGSSSCLVISTLDR